MTMRISAEKARLEAATKADPRWASVVARDAKADGAFCYSVATTGIYCRPSCGARRARPENVRFYATAQDAENAGFRPCKRCKPNEESGAGQHAATIAAICRQIAQSEEMPGLGDLASQAGLSVWHFHRVFKAFTGVTPRQYAMALRARRVRSKLSKSSAVTDVIYDAGYNSSGRFYEASNQVLGMTPTSYRAGGEGERITFAVGDCSIGSILVAASERGICTILLGDDPAALTRNLQDRFPRADLVGGDARFEQLISKVVGFIEAPAIGLDLPLDIRGTAFQHRVWQALRRIPAGETVTYQEIARRIGSPKAVRAVGHACAENPIAVAIPCHRVVRRDGDSSGYRWGIERKRELLEREGRA
jgi:AraC family transcriptional regulator of adaptative response/methylated-DNA-[protein]-cysteine methyltransferase